VRVIRRVWAAGLCGWSLVWSFAGLQSIAVGLLSTTVRLMLGVIDQSIIFAFDET